jgi:hypothetical protein
MAMALTVTWLGAVAQDPSFRETSSSNAPSGVLTANPVHAAAAGITVSQLFNGFFDNILAATDRFLEWPLFVVLGLVGIACLILALVIHRCSVKGARSGVIRILFGAEVVLTVLAVVFVLDRKIARLESAMTELRQKTSADTAALLNVVAKLEAQRRSFLCDPAEVQKALTERFGEVSLRPLIYDEATDIVQVHVKKPLVQAYMAVIDLTNPAVEIKLGATLEKKTSTTSFARESDCTVAINGEAGNSPSPNSGLGGWRGNLVRAGQVLLRENPRFPAPFLCFDEQNRAQFISASSSNRDLPTNACNVIWGRWDAVVEGTVQKGDHGNRQPRTAMAINQDGTRLFLLVADGRQPSYSMGFTREGAGLCLKAFGAYNAMLCDEGGSSCIYLKQFGGIANIPADDYGHERPTYTHFGIRLKSPK